MKEIRQIPLLAIKPDPGQPRKDFDDESLRELVQSIRQNGLLNPIVAKPDGGGQFIIVAGERRYRAHQLLDTETIECIVYNGDNTQELQLIENINRKDLNPVEVVGAYWSYLDKGHTLDELSEVVGKPKNTLSWLLNLERCRPEVQHLVGQGQLSLVVGISLSKLSENGQMQALRTFQSSKLDVAECRAVCQKIEAVESQPEIFSIVELEVPRLTEEEVKVRGKIQNAIGRACQAMQEINNLELDSPGISAQAIAEKLDITQEKIDMLYKLVGQFQKNLRQRRVAALC